jgi:hypothetical protein
MPEPQRVSGAMMRSRHDIGRNDPFEADSLDDSTSIRIAEKYEETVP